MPSHGFGCSWSYPIRFFIPNQIASNYKTVDNTGNNTTTYQMTINIAMFLRQGTNLFDANPINYLSGIKKQQQTESPANKVKKSQSHPISRKI